MSLIATIEDRTAPFTVVRADEEGDGLTLEGYAAVFNSPTLIREMGGEFEEVIAPGAFKKSLQLLPPVLMFEHGQHPVLGGMPIGSIKSLREDATGLRLEARLFDNWMTEPLRDALREKAIEGMSFRFEAVRDTRDTGRSPELRTLREVKLYELGPVVFPAYKDTTVALRSLAAHVPGLMLTLERGHKSDEERIAALDESARPGTSEDAARSAGTSEDAAEEDAQAESHSPPTPSTADERKRLGRQIEAARMGAGKK